MELNDQQKALNIKEIGEERCMAEILVTFYWMNGSILFTT